MTRRFTPTAEQQALIDLSDGNHLIHAPPGAGKTQVLVERIVRLLKDSPQAGFRVLALTFSTKAAESLRERVRLSTGETSARVTACTFHAFCLSALQAYGQMVGFPSSTMVFERLEDRKSVLAKAIVDAGLSPRGGAELTSMLDQIGRFKRDLRGPQTIEDRQLAEIYAGYDLAMRRMNGCDFDDLLWIAWRLFSERPAVARHYRRIYRYIMVDEAQDTSRAQYELLRALCGVEHGRVMLVADEDQLIHGYSGASAEWLQAFQRDFQAEEHRLTTNFRSARLIVQAATAMIQNNEPGSAHRAIAVADTDAPGDVRAIAYADEVSEADGIVEFVKWLLERGLNPEWLHPGEDCSVLPEEIGVFGRNQHNLLMVHDRLVAKNIPVLFRAGQQELVESPLGRLLLQGLRLLHNPADLITQENVLQTWLPGVSHDALLPSSPSALFARLAQESPEARALAELLGDQALTSDVSRLMPRAFACLGEIGQEPSLNGDSAVDREALHADILTLTQRWEAYKGHVLGPDRTLAGFLAELSLAGRSVVDGPGVRLMTIHAAKGLEFRAVVLIGLNDGTLPDYRAMSEREIADERRLCYVAVTRAARALLLTRARTRQLRDRTLRPQVESRFVRELGVVMVDEAVIARNVTPRESLPPKT